MRTVQDNLVGKKADNPRKSVQARERSHLLCVREPSSRSRLPHPDLAVEVVPRGKSIMCGFSKLPVSPFLELAGVRRKLSWYLEQ